MGLFPLLARYKNMEVQAKQFTQDGLQYIGRITGGKIIYCCSTGSATNDGLSPSRPISTLDAAINLCTQTGNVGDIIYVLPGHAENIATATALNFDVPGITIIGIGVGGQRPTITFTTANTATIPVSAANISISNCVFVANFLSIAAPFTLSTATDFVCYDCLFRETSNVLNFLNIFKSTGAANTVDGLTLINNMWAGKGTTSVNSFVLSANDIDRLTLLYNRVILARTATAAVMATISAGILSNADVRWNTAISQQTADTGGGFINVGGTTSSGIVSDNVLGDLSTTDLFVTTSVALTFSNNKKTGVVSASGYLLPATDS